MDDKSNQNQINIHDIPLIPETLDIRNATQLLQNKPCSKELHIFLRSCLDDIEQSYAKQLMWANEELKIQKRRNTEAIANIDEQMYILQQQKKEIKLQNVEFNHKQGQLMDKLSRHKNFVHQVSLKYETAINDDFKINQVTWTNFDFDAESGGTHKYNLNDNDKDGVMCLLCAHWAQNKQELMLHLTKCKKKHNHNNLSQLQWKKHIIELLCQYKFCIDPSDFEEKVYKLFPSDKPMNLCSSLFSSDKPLLPPQETQYQINARNHNKQVLQSLNNNDDNIYPDSMNLANIFALNNEKNKNDINADDLQTILQLVNNNDDNKYPDSINLADIFALNIGDMVDFRDYNGRYCETQILAKETGKETNNNNNNNKRRFGLTFINFTSVYNIYSYPDSDFSRYAKHKTISQRPIHRHCMKYVQVGSKIECKPLFKWQYEMRKKTIDFAFISKYLQWNVSEVLKTLNSSAQVLVLLYEQDNNKKWHKPPRKYKNNQWVVDQRYIHWVHLDNEKECAPINTHIQSY